ncbi:hypothetical protein RJT34_22322 [Clitoria ternatea]|uniref:BHLH domain-containing protein n=1 Tax=Clitoria ternatea TaxID=43366 RepID=A0AAN9IV58_CLITE
MHINLRDLSKLIDTIGNRKRIFMRMVMDHNPKGQIDHDKFLTQSAQHPPNLSFQSVGCDSSTMQYYDATNSTIFQDFASHHKTSPPSPSTSSFLPFENSAKQPTLHGCNMPNFTQHLGNHATSASILCSKRNLSGNNHINKPKAKQGTKKLRSSSEFQDHVMAERKRRQELTERFIALSATIPGLKKTEKAYVLGEAISYMKQLQERVNELENHNKRKTADSVIFIKKFQVCSKEESMSCETNSEGGYRSSTSLLPQVEARVMEREVLIGIHCKKEKDIVFKIVALLQNLHLSLASSSVLPFGTSTLKVTIIAQMGEKYCITVSDLVKILKQHLLGVAYH